MVYFLIIVALVILFRFAYIYFSLDNIGEEYILKFGKTFFWKMPVLYNFPKIVKIGVYTSLQGEFEIKLHPSNNHIAKFFRLCKETRIGNETQCLYLTSDDKALVKLINDNAAIQQVILTIFTQNITRINCNKKKLWLELNNESKENKIRYALDEKVIEEYVEVLRTVDDFMHKNYVYSDENEKFYSKQAKNLLIANSTLAITGIFGWLFAYDKGEKFFHPDLKLFSIVLSACLVTLWIGVVFICIRKSVRGMRIVIESITTGSIGVTLSTYVLLVFLNCFLDFSNPTEYELSIRDKEVVNGKKHTAYYLITDHWEKVGQRYRFQISERQFNQVHIGEMMSINVKEGLLGFKWIKSKAIPLSVASFKE
jgi:hypothetical protein